MIKNKRNEYKLHPVLCKYCSTPLSFERKRYTFCNSSCAASFNNKGICRVKKRIPKTRKCIYCDTILIGQSKKYCNNICQGRYKHDKYINEWFKSKIYEERFLPNNIRLYIIELHDTKCDECGWNKINPSTGNSPLNIDHIDGNCKNNSMDNLRVLCPNCHSLTPTYGALNKGKSKRIHRCKHN